MACEDFKKTKNPAKMAAKAKKIYEDFIQSEGPREVRGSCYVFCFYIQFVRFYFIFAGTKDLI